MKSRLILSMVFLFTLLSMPFLVSAQQWTDKLPQKSETYNLFEYQKAFNDYWEPFGVDGGYYFNEQGERTKAPGWKLFKRFEWYWESRVDPVTGAFPEDNRIDHFRIEKDRSMSSATRDSDGNWSSLGPNTSPGGYAGLGRINTIGFRAGDANTYYAGSPSGGLWKTTNDGANWTVLTDDNDVLGVSDIAVIAGATTANDILFIGTGDRDGGSMHSLNGGHVGDNHGIGVLTSTNGGASWGATGLSFPASDRKRVSRILLDPNDNNTILVSVLGYFSIQGNVYRSTDQGVTFTDVSNNRFIDMEYRPGSSDTVYGSTEKGDIYRSLDGGVTWALINLDFGAGRTELAVSSDDPARVYAITVNTATNGLWAIWRSNDGGNNWAKYFNGTLANQNLLGYPCDASDNKGQGNYDLCIAADPVNADILYIGGINTWKSTNGGSSWTISSHWSDGTCAGGVDVVHADKHFLGFQPGTNHIFEGNDGGIYKNQTGNSTDWEWLGDGMAIGQIYRIGLSPNTETTYISGLQDNGSKTATGGTWDDNIGGDGMECIVDYTDDNIQYVTGPNGDLYKTTVNWNNNNYIQLVDADTLKGGWVTPYALDPDDNNTIYLGAADMWKSTNGGTSFSKIGNFAAGTRPGKLLSLAICEKDPNRIYTADDDTLRKSEDGGATWSIITGSLPVATSRITYISVHDSMPDTAWVSLGQYNSHGVYQTFDGGATWTNISTGLPQVPVMSVIHYKYNTSQIVLYAATDIGVYLKVGDGNWSRFSDGLPNVVCTELEIFYDTVGGAIPKLRAATFGRGLWESDIYTGGDIPIPEFEVDNEYPDTGDTITFTDKSQNVPTMWTWEFTPSAGVTFVNGTTANTVNPQVKFANEGEYDVKLIAENGAGKDSLIKAAYVTVSDLPTGYCSAKGGNGFASIIRVRYGTIDNTTTFDGTGYEDHTSISTVIEKGSSHDLTVNVNNADTTDIAGFIDWNHDGDFSDPSEEIACGSTTTTGVVVFTINTPNWAKSGKTMMRVRSKWLGAGCGIPCSNTANGEVEDYSIVVIPGTPTTAPTADFSADDTSPSINQTVHFLDLSTELPDSWTWVITPSDFQFVNGTSSSSAIPEVIFTSTGMYTIQLTVSNALGSDTEVKTDYIDVQAAPPYCAAGSTGGAVGISLVQLNTINKATGLSSNPNFYEDYTATDQTNLKIGTNYNLTVNSFNPQNFNDLFAWIDWNGDGDFDDANELIGCGVDVGTDTIFNFTVPSTALLNTTRMRVRGAFNKVCASVSPCGLTPNGEVEDYGITIEAGDANWTGTNSSDWDDGGNWDIGQVPAFTSNVTISTTANDPVIDGVADVKDLTLNSNASLTLTPGAFLTIEGDLTIAAAKNNRAAATMTIESDASGNGSVIVKGTMTGDANVERYLAAYTSNADGWHLLSSPVTNTITINASDFDPGASDDFYAWSESEGVWKNHKQGNPADIMPSEGYLVAYATDKTGTFTGPLATADVSVSGLSVTNGGWHLRGNPFPSAISWNAPSADWGLSNIAGIAKVWDETAANYADIPAGSPIPSTNGFFVQANDDGGSGFDIPASARVHSTQGNYKQGEESFDRTLVLRVSNDVNPHYDINRIGLREDATEAWDMAFDARKLYGRSAAPQLWTLLASEYYSWNNIPLPTETYSLPLHFKPGVTAGYTLLATGLNSFKDSEVIYLEDLFTGQTIDLFEQPVYQFAAAKDDETNRFVLHFYGATTIDEPYATEEVTIYSSGQEVFVRFKELPKETVDLIIYNTYGKAVYKRRLHGNLLERIPLQEIPGVYIVRVQTTEGMITGKVLIK